MFAVLEGMGGKVLFARPADPAAWDARIRSGAAEEDRWTVGSEPGAADELAARLLSPDALPLALRRGATVRPFGGDLEAGDVIEVLRAPA
jgi:hypothetical protein